MSASEAFDLSGITHAAFRRWAMGWQWTPTQPLTAGCLEMERCGEEVRIPPEHSRDYERRLGEAVADVARVAGVRLEYAVAGLRSALHSAAFKFEGAITIESTADFDARVDAIMDKGARALGAIESAADAIDAAAPPAARPRIASDWATGDSPGDPELERIEDAFIAGYEAGHKDGLAFDAVSGGGVEALRLFNLRGQQ